MGLLGSTNRLLYHPSLRAFFIQLERRKTRIGPAAACGAPDIMANFQDVKVTDLDKQEVVLSDEWKDTPVLLTLVRRFG